MMTRRRIAWTVLATVAATAALSLASQPAEAHGRRPGRVVFGRAFYGGFYGPYFGWGYSPFFEPYYFGPGAYGVGFRPEGGVDMNAAAMAGIGAIDVDAKPDRADVWVDGRYVGEARDLDGYPSFLWLQPGTHRVAVYKGGFRTFEEEIEVRRGMKTTLKLKLQPGDSQPPGSKPGASAAGAPARD